jgi:signal transduction histidine kinase
VSEPATNLEDRFLVVAPTGRDAALTCDLLAQAGLRGEACRTLAEVGDEAERGAAGLILAEEVLVPENVRRLADLLARQPPWSDLPILVFTGQGATIQARSPTVELLAPLGNVTLLDRPVRPITLISAARAALRARKRQYQAREALERQRTAVRQRDQFLAMLGHELRNPLGVILLATELLENGEDVAPQREVLRRQARHLTRLVDDLLDVARVTSGKVALRRQPLDLVELVGRCVQSVQPRARHLTVTLDAPPAMAVDGDADRLEQVFVNLLTNAAKYTPPGGHVAVVVETADGEAVVSVRDDGVGLTADMLPRVFDLFAQAEGTLDRAQGGLGIGLTLVRSLVELHGGAVEARSAGPGTGAEFVVRLPLSDAAGAAASPDADRRAGPTRRILIVEDNADTRDLLKVLLEARGHAVDVAADGAEGVDRALRLAPDAMIVDIGLPGLDGYAVARRLRAHFGASLLLVALTGYGQPEDRRRALEAGFDVHCTKPVDAERLDRLLADGRPAA